MIQAPISVHLVDFIFAFPKPLSVYSDIPIGNIVGILFKLLYKSRSLVCLHGFLAYINKLICPINQPLIAVGKSVIIGLKGGYIGIVQRGIKIKEYIHIPKTKQFS